MKKLPFFDDFQVIDPTVNPKVLKIELKDYQVDIYISNLIVAGSKSFPVTKSFFGSERVSVTHDSTERALKISIPRVMVPNQDYPLREISGYLMKVHKGDWILGINDFGPVHFEISRLTHAIVIGASGYGKSSFFKYLLAQTLAHQSDIVNVIVDPKRVDYSLFADHPNVYMVADNKEKWINLFYLLITEIETRKEFFTRSFKRSPSNLEEYKDFRKAYSRDDLPKFDRILVWIDEYHILQRQDQYSPVETEKECLGYISRVGRAFGIHLMLSSQTYTDFSSEIRNQASTVFNFYTNSAGYISDQIPVLQSLAIPGRLNQSLGKEVLENIQAPFLSTEESIGYAWKFSDLTKKKISPFYPLRLKPCDDFGKEFVLPLMQGHGLYKGATKKSGSSGKINDELFRRHHFIEKGANTQEPAIAELPRPSLVEMIKIDPSDNRLKIDQILKQLELKSDFDLTWCLFDKEKNYGVQLCYRNMINPYLSPDDARETMNVYNLALNYQNNQTLLKFLSDIENTLPTSGSSPLLIIKGRDGMGKRTILHVVAHHLGLSYRPIEPDDLLQAKEGEPEKKDEIIVIENIKVAAEFCRHPGSNLHPVLLLDSTPVRGFFGSSSDFRLDDLRFLNVFFHFIDLDAKNYSSEEVCDVLLKGILTKYSYDFTSGYPSPGLLASKGVPLVPGKIDALIARAASRCKYFSKRFQYQDFIEELNSFEMIRDYNEHEAVQVLKPIRGFDDLVIHSSLKEQLGLLLNSVKDGDNKYKFHQKLRQKKRNISLFFGESGTGKSLAAEALAKELGKDLWVVNFGDMQSMMVGETEKILSGLFERASLSGQVLLIDECEVFLKSRENEQSEYMGRIVNHLLNLFEGFSGILILTTNYAANIDKAFSRRMDTKINFPLPDEEQMGMILKTLLEPDAPMAEELNTALIFEGLRLSGGLIRNGVERVVQKKIAGHEKFIITNEDLRSGMLQIYLENKGFLESRNVLNKIGLTT